jgi:hypothetical protein
MIEIRRAVLCVVKGIERDHQVSQLVSRNQQSPPNSLPPLLLSPVSYDTLPTSEIPVAHEDRDVGIQWRIRIRNRQQ